MIYKFIRVTQVAPVYRFCGVFFLIFLIELEFVIAYFFHIIFLKNNFEKKPCIFIKSVTTSN